MILASQLGQLTILATPGSFFESLLIGANAGFETTSFGLCGSLSFSSGWETAAGGIFPRFCQPLRKPVRARGGKEAAVMAA